MLRGVYSCGYNIYLGGRFPSKYRISIDFGNDAHLNFSESHLHQC